MENINQAANADPIARIRDKIPKERVVGETADFFKVFGDTTRLKIVNALSAGELCVCDISAALEMTVSAISHQLKILRQARIITSRREGKHIFYKLDDEHIYSIFQAAAEHINERIG